MCGCGAYKALYNAAASTAQNFILSTRKKLLVHAKGWQVNAYNAKKT